jgi:uncharacterized protein (TIGR02145 family)
MIYRNLSRLLIVFLLSVTISCNSEKKKYAELLQKQDLKLAYEFKSKFPESNSKVDSLIQSLEYKKVGNSQSIPELTKFIEKFPKNPYKDSIMNKLYQIERENLKENWSIEAINKYLAKYPNSPYTNELENWIFGNASLGTFTDGRDATKYKWKKIGSQVWMAENLRATKYNDGINLTRVMDNKVWAGLSTPAYCYYNALNDQRNEDILYNYGVVMTNKICPVGWHVPTREEWQTLIIPLGSWYEAGDKLKKASDNPNWADRFGISANMGGWRNEFGEFSGANRTGVWWGTSKDVMDWAYWMYSDSPSINEKIEDKRRGFSIRCLKD